MVTIALNFGGLVQNQLFVSSSPPPGLLFLLQVCSCKND